MQNKFTDLNLQNKLGDSPLIASAIRSHPEVVDLLLKAGADPSITNNTDGSALSVATNNQGTVTILLCLHIFSQITDKSTPWVENRKKKSIRLHRRRVRRRFRRLKPLLQNCYSNYESCKSKFLFQSSIPKSTKTRKPKNQAQTLFLQYFS